MIVHRGLGIPALVMPLASWTERTRNPEPYANPRAPQ